MNLIPTTTPVTGGVSANRISLTPKRYKVAIKTSSGAPGGWGTIRNTISGFMIGHVKDGWTFDRLETGESNPYVWYQGRAYGNYNYCGWLLAANLDAGSGTASTSCAGSTISESDFASRINVVGSDQRLSAVKLTTSAQMHANVHPWQVPATPTDPLRSPLKANTCVEWRYISRDGKWVAIKDRSVADPDGSWGFIPRSALPSTLPQGTAGCP